MRSFKWLTRYRQRGADLDVTKESASTTPDTTSKACSRRNSSSHTTESDDKSPPDEISYRYLQFSTVFQESPLPSELSEYAATEAPLPPDLSPYADPTTWPRSRKLLITWLSFVLATVSSYNPGAYSAGVGAYSAEWGISRTASLSGITVWASCFALGPMFLAPFSELKGRLPVFVPAGLVFIVSQIAAAVTRSWGGMVVSRMLAGVSSSVFSTMISGVLADIFDKEERNTAMAIFAGGTMLGTGLGPVPSGALLQYLGWRWIWYVQIISVGLSVAAMLVVFRETRGSILLSRKAKALNEWYDQIDWMIREESRRMGTDVQACGAHTTILDGEKAQRVRWKVKEDEKRASLRSMVKASLIGPFHLLVTESVVFWFSLWVGFAWAILFMGFRAFPQIMIESHGFDDAQNGAIFTSLCVGALVSIPLGIWQGHIAKKLSFVPDTPEGRLVLTGIQGTLVPISLFWLGWTSYPSVHWIAPVMSAGALTIGVYGIYLAVFNYFSDVYHEYASSANAAQSFARNVAGGVIPLFTNQMFDAMTFQGGCSMLGGIAILLAFVPFILIRYGESIRARSKFARQLESA